MTQNPPKRPYLSAAENLPEPQEATTKRRTLLALASAAPLAILAACSPEGSKNAGDRPAGSEQKDATPASPQAPAKPVTMTVFGDSITAGGPDFVDAQTMGEGSWTRYLTSEKFRIIRGTAKSGYWTEKLLPDVTPVDSDAVLIALGTNDILAIASDYNYPAVISWVQDSMKALVAKAGAEKKKIIVSAIGPRPSSMRPQDVEPYNRDMAAWTRKQGWSWVDPWGALRETASTFKAGLSSDELHPNFDGAKLLGQGYSEAIDRAL